MGESFIEFIDPEQVRSSVDRTLNKKSCFRAEFRIPILEEVDIPTVKVNILNKEFNVSNISSSGFQVLTDDDSMFKQGEKRDFEFFFDGKSIKGMACVKYIEKYDLNLYAVGMEIISFLETKDVFFNLLNELKKKIINGNK